MRKLLALAAVLAVALASVAYAATKSVGVRDNFFRPTKLTISKGTKVTWKWSGKVPHNVTVTKGPQKFNSRTQTTGSYSHVFRKAGTYKILCTIHAPGMKMTVVVH